MYLWWSERRGVREGEIARSSAHLAQLIRSYAEECSPLKQIGMEPALPRPRAVWSRPPDGFAKLNYDGAFKQGDRSGGWGFVLGDGDGTVISSEYGRLGKVLEPVHAKIIALAGTAESSRTRDTECGFGNRCHNGCSGRDLIRVRPGTISVRDSIPACIQVLVAEDLVLVIA